MGAVLGWRMADLKVRQLENRVASALKSRAERRGVSLEEEVRSTLTASVEARRQAFARRAAACRRSSGGRPGRPLLDSVKLIRKDRDASG